MKSVRPHCHVDPYIRSKKPSVCIPPSLPIIVCYHSPSLLVVQIFGVQNVEISHGRSLRIFLCIQLSNTAMWSIFKVKQASKSAYSWFCRWSGTIDHIFVGDQDFQLQKCKISCGRPLRPWLCRRFTLMAMQANFRGQSSLEAHIPHFCWWLCAISNHVCWWSLFKTSKILKYFVYIL